jgi:hypothetical protein
LTTLYLAGAKNIDIIHSDRSYLNKCKRIIYMSYHHYSPTLSGELRATKEGTCDTSESKATCTRVQRAPPSSSIKSVLRPDLSTSSSASSSGEFDTTASNAERDTQRAPLAAVVSIQPSRSSTTVNKALPIPELVQPKSVEPPALHSPPAAQPAPL